MKVKEESEKTGLKLNSQKTKIMASDPTTSWQIDGETMKAVAWANTQDPTHDRSWGRKPDKPGGSGFQGFRKAAPGIHLKDDICLSDACFYRLLPNFCDTGRRPSPISSQIRVNLEL